MMLYRSLVRVFPISSKKFGFSRRSWSELGLRGQDMGLAGAAIRSSPGRVLNLVPFPALLIKYKQ